MRDSYPDQYGIDSLPQLREASKLNCTTFITINKHILEDREELERVFHIKIRTPTETIKE